LASYIEALELVVEPLRSVPVLVPLVGEPVALGCYRRELVLERSDMRRLRIDRAASGDRSARSGRIRRLRMAASLSPAVTAALIGTS
jgi:hypothetical protein